MARRTTSDLVLGILGPKFDSTVDVSPFIDTASKIVDKLESKQTTSGCGDPLDEQHLELIERWLSAHYATLTYRNHIVTSESIGAASKSYSIPTPESGISSTPYGQQAIAIDTSGILRRLGSPCVGVSWLGDDYDA